MARAEFPRGVVGDGGTRSWVQNTSRLIAATTEFHPVGVMWISIHASVVPSFERRRARSCTAATTLYNRCAGEPARIRVGAYRRGPLVAATRVTALGWRRVAWVW